jgi:hypothetical protein
VDYLDAQKYQLLINMVTQQNINVICLQEMHNDLEKLITKLNKSGKWKALRGDNPAKNVVVWNTSVLGDNMYIWTHPGVCAVRFRGDLIIVSASTLETTSTLETISTLETTSTLETLKNMAKSENADLIIGISTNNDAIAYDENYNSANTDGFTTAKRHSNVNAQLENGGKYAVATKDRILFFERQRDTWTVSTKGVINNNTGTYTPPNENDLGTLLPNDIFPSDHAMVYAQFKNVRGFNT